MLDLLIIVTAAALVTAIVRIYGYYKKRKKANKMIEEFERKHPGE